MSESRTADSYEERFNWHKTKYGYARERPLGSKFAPKAPDGKQTIWFIIVTKDEHDEWAEELDIEAVSEPAARELAKDVLKRDYQPGLRVEEVRLA